MPPAWLKLNPRLMHIRPFRCTTIRCKAAISGVLLANGPRLARDRLWDHLTPPDRYYFAHRCVHVMTPPGSGRYGAYYMTLTLWSGIAIPLLFLDLRVRRPLNIIPRTRAHLLQRVYRNTIIPRGYHPEVCFSSWSRGDRS